MFIVFLVGTAGAGKSLLTAAFSEWLRGAKQDVALVNLDPGVVTLPYTPNLDARDFVNIERLMTEYNLGPNGALIMATDLLAEQTETLSREVEDIDADLVLVDTPGQIELFAFRASGQYITEELTQEPKALIYLFDSVFSLNPLNYVANLFLSAAVHTRFLIPQARVLSKCDLLPEDRVKGILDWSADPKMLEEAIDKKLEGTKRLLSHDILHTMNRLGLSFSLIPMSATTNSGMTNLNMVLERMFSGGDKFTF